MGSNRINDKMYINIKNASFGSAGFKKTYEYIDFVNKWNLKFRNRFKYH